MITVSIMNGGSNNYETTSEQANGLATDFVTEGVIGSITNTAGVAPATGAFAANAQGTPNMTIAVSAGTAYVTGTPSSQASQTFRVVNSASENVTISANSSGSTKYDWVYIKLDATLLNNPAVAGDTTATLVTSRSTSASTDDGTPPTYGYPIARVVVSNGASSITNGNIFDLRENCSLLAAAVTTGLNVGWTTPTQTVSSVTNNGNRSYDVVFNSTVASVLSPGMRLRTTRTVTAPTQCADLEASSSQYFSATSASLAGMTFTDDFTCMGWIKVESYGAGVTGIITRSGAGANGWRFELTSSGQVQIIGLNSAGNNRSYYSYQSVPLGRWVHVAASANLSDGASGGLIYIDGVLVPSTTTLTGAISALVQSGDLAVGSLTGGTNFRDGKLAQVAVFSSVLSASTIRSYMSQGLSGSESTLVSAFSCNNSLLDLNTTNNNDLTANGGALMTNADSPFGQDSNGVTAGTTDYALVMQVSGSTATVQVPEGCTIPTSGGVSAVAYSTAKSPFGFTTDRGRWRLSTFHRVNVNTTSNATYGSFNSNGNALTVPVGSWTIGHQYGVWQNSTTTAVYVNLSPTALTGLTSSTGYDASPFAFKTLSPAAAESDAGFHVSGDITQSTAQTWVVYTLGATTNSGPQGAQNRQEIYAIPAGI